MEPISILHTADLHLGSALPTLGVFARSRRGELLDTFRRITEICTEKRIRLLLIAGDFLETAEASAATVASVKHALGAMPYTDAFIAPGNHDPFALDAPYADEDWPSNVHIFRGPLSRVDLDDVPVSVYGAGFTTTLETQSLNARWPEPDAARIQIGLLHADLVASGQRSVYNGITQSDLERSGLDYVAMGHIHKRTEILTAGKTAYSYSGCPDGTGYDDVGEQGVRIGHVGKGWTDLSFFPTSSRQFLRTTVRLSEEEDTDAVVEAVLRRLETHGAESVERDFHRVVVRGTLPLHHAVDWEQVRHRLAQHLYAFRLHEQTVPALDLHALKEEVSLRGAFVRALTAEQADAQEDEARTKRLQRALDLGLRALEGQEVDFADHTDSY